MNDRLYRFRPDQAVFETGTTQGKQVLLANSYYLQEILLHWFAADGEFLDDGADPNTHLWNGCSLLILACSKGRLEIVKLLLDKGADINYQMKDYDDRDPGTALSCAVNFNREELVQLLLSKGADVTIKDREGFTVLDRMKEAREFKLKRYGPNIYTERAKDERIILY
jgi:ankyrin repeat protein